MIQISQKWPPRNTLQSSWLHACRSYNGVLYYVVVLRCLSGSQKKGWRTDKVYRNDFEPYLMPAGISKHCHLKMHLQPTKCHFPDVTVIYTVRSLFDKMNFHEIRGTLMLKIEWNVLNSTMELDFEIFGSIIHNLELKIVLFWIRAKNAS